MGRASIIGKGNSPWGLVLGEGKEAAAYTCLTSLFSMECTHCLCPRAKNSQGHLHLAGVSILYLTDFSYSLIFFQLGKPKLKRQGREVKPGLKQLT